MNKPLPGVPPSPETPLEQFANNAAGCERVACYDDDAAMPLGMMSGPEFAIAVKELFAMRASHERMTRARDEAVQWIDAIDEAIKELRAALAPELAPKESS